MAQFKTFSSITSENYIKKNLEEGRIVSYRDLGDNGMAFVKYKDLPKTEIKGYPFSSDFIDNEGNVYSNDEFAKLDQAHKKQCELRFSFMSNYHELYVGTTGSGKTTGCMEPQIRAVSSQKNKPNLFITDPKGELFEHHARYLSKMGYNVFVLNFKDFSKTHRWNPLGELYDIVYEIRRIGKDAKLVKGKAGPNIDLQSPLEDFGDEYYEYEGKGYPTKKMLKAAIEVERYSLSTKATSLASQYASAMLPVESKSDPMWEEGCRGLLFAIIMIMFYQALDEKKEFAKDMFTLKTVSDTFALIRSAFEGDKNAKLKMSVLESGVPLEILEKLHAVTRTADTTAKGFFSTFESRMTSWFSGHIFFLTSGTNIDISDEKAPFAIFVSTRDYEKSDFMIAGSFIDWVYRQMLLKADSAPKNSRNEPMVRDTHFMLDEFGNIPKIPDFEIKIATARSRKIWFHLFIQSFEQLDIVYGREGAQVIIDNCNQQSFLGSQSNATKKRFSDECGSKTIRSYESQIKETYSWNTVPVVPVSDLDLIKTGEIFVKRIYFPVIKGEYIRSYICAEYGYFEDFRDEHAVRDLAPFNDILPNDELHTYKGIRKPVTPTEVLLGIDDVSEGATFEKEEFETPEEEEESVDTEEPSSDSSFVFPDFSWIKDDEDGDK